MIRITQEQINDLRKKGFSQEEIDQAIKEIEEEDSGDYITPSNPNKSYSAFGHRPSDDVAKQQLELNDILEKAEHILRGDIVSFENGQAVWIKNPNPSQNTLNEFGVHLCMKILGMYINRNTILSDYTDEEIRYKVLDFGKRFNDLVFLKYDEMGLDTEEKRKEYASLVGAMVDIVHSAYARAKDGMERESYRKMISVSQANQGIGGYPNINVTGGNTMPSTRGILNPMRYIAGKYK